MRLLIIVSTLLFFLSCNRQVLSELDLPKQRFETFEVSKIDSTSNAYFIECERKNRQPIVIVSWKEETENCYEKIQVRKKYSMNLKVETFMAGDYDGYIIDGKEYPLETIIAFTDDLKGLCVIN